MRIATMIISLLLMLVVGAQSCAVSLGGAAFKEKAAEQGGAVGILMALLFLIGGAFALAFPLVSLVAFLLSGLLGLAAGASTSFTDLTIWGVVSLVLAVLSYFGWREKRKRRREEEAVNHTRKNILRRRLFKHLILPLIDTIEDDEERNRELDRAWSEFQRLLP